MDVLSPFSSVRCHSDWLYHEESCPRTDVVHPGRAWSSSPACTWHCSLHYLFLQATPCFLMVWPLYANFLALTVSNSTIFTLALQRTHSFVFFAVHETSRIFLSPFISKASTRAPGRRPPLKVKKFQILFMASASLIIKINRKCCKSTSVNNEILHIV